MLGRGRIRKCGKVGALDVVVQFFSLFGLWQATSDCCPSCVPYRRPDAARPILQRQIPRSLPALERVVTGYIHLMHCFALEIWPHAGQLIQPKKSLFWEANFGSFWWCIFFVSGEIPAIISQVEHSKPSHKPNISGVYPDIWRGPSIKEGALIREGQQCFSFYLHAVASDCTLCLAMPQCLSLNPP